MYTQTEVENPDERIVRIQETMDSKTRTFYAIRDKGLDYWRSNSPLHSYDAWTRDLERRAEFNSRKDAQRELKAIRKWRPEAA